ncbi:MAG: BamA/TamA family outer membrane protein [Deltaproteobacteria bacterium]|nr:BamA/TamA family outer membrane protein [Deltaproteobacteria bacterium]
MATRSVPPRIPVLAWACVLALLPPSRTLAQPPNDSPATIQLSTPADLSKLGRLPISRIDVVQTGDRWRSPATLTSVRVGDVFNAATARRAARELLDSGGFSNAVITALPEADGVALRFELTPRRVIAIRRLDGAAFDEAEVWRDAQVEVGGELTEASLPQIAEAVRRYHMRHGYPSARARIETRDTDAPLRVVLVVEVTPGDPLRVAARQIVIPEAERPALEEIAESYAVGRRDRIDEVRLEEADKRLVELLRARSWPKARVAHLVVASGGNHFLYVYVTPGPRLRLRFEGNHTFDADQLADAIDYEKEADRTPAHLAAKVQAFYRSLGLLDVQVDFEERGTDKDSINDLVFKVREGEIVRVTRRVFPCLTGTRSPAEVESEVDSFLTEELPGMGLMGPVDPAIVDRLFGPTSPGGARPAPLEPDPTRTMVASVYDKAIKHVQDLYRSEGYLSALVGPIQIVRRKCDPRSPADKCIPLPLPPTPEAVCRFDARGLPLEGPDPDPGLLCRPNLAKGVRCEPNLEVRIPVKLGPRATLHDLQFEGNRTLVESELATETGLVLGGPASNLELEQARRKILDLYRDQGFAFADVRASLDLSPDHTRARARFIINESEQVIVDHIVVQGAERTSRSLILGRVALEPGKPYRQSLVRKSEERIATLGTFSTVTISLQDPYVPARRKVVVVNVAERLPQYLDIRPGFSTGEGFRIQFEYGHRNIAGEAVQLTFRIRLGYLPDMFILDPQVRKNLDTLPVAQRMERLNAASVLFPEVGLGPLISLGIDGIDVRSNARDFGLTKDALSSALNYRPVRTFTSSLGVSVERNDVAIFNGQTVEQYLSQPGVTADLGRLLRVPDGLTFAVAQRLTTSWDRRDNPFGATRGTLLGLAVEHVRAFPASDNPNSQLSDFLRTRGTVAGYVRLSKRGLAFAATVRGGIIQQLMANSKTYPDRLFFLGGVDSMRGFLQDALVPQDIADRIAADSSQAANDPTKLTINQVAIRGGDVFINPRAELRVPLSEQISTALFLDTGNVWVDPKNFNPVQLRYASGTGLRIGTPIGPIAFDYGINLMRRSWEDFGAFHFSIGLF